MARTGTQTTSFTCVSFDQGNHQMVFFLAKASVLWESVDINRRSEDKDEGYQRTLSPSRVRDIAKYIDGKKPIPISILLSFDNAQLSANKKKVTIPKSKAGWVIDGQHRLAGAHEAKSDLVLPVIAFLNLDVEGQIEQFVTINTKALGVPKSLYLDLLPHLKDKKPSEIAAEKARDIAEMLKKDETSPFYGRIVVTSSPKTGEISLTQFVRKFTPLILENRILEPYTLLEQRVIMANYFLALRNVFPTLYGRKDSVFFKTLGFGALLNALPTFFSICLKEHQAFRVADATKVFQEINHFDFSSWSKGTGSAAEKEAGEDLIVELRKALVEDSSEGHLRLF